jgi:hypothetical protein
MIFVRVDECLTHYHGAELLPQSKQSPGIMPGQHDPVYQQDSRIGSLELVGTIEKLLLTFVSMIQSQLITATRHVRGFTGLTIMR